MTTPFSALPKIILVAAVGRRGVIGRDGGLVWREPLDAKHFRDTTMGLPVIMGRKTWDSVPERFRPLPGRRNVVVTRQANWQAQGAEAASSLGDALRRTADSSKVAVIGGAQLYAAALPLADALVLTEVDADFDGDVHFPPWDRATFVETRREAHNDAAGRPFAFVVYERVRIGA